MNQSIRYSSVAFAILVICALFSQIIEKVLGVNLFAAALILVLFCAGLCVRGLKYYPVDIKIVIFYLLLALHFIVTAYLFPCGLAAKELFTLLLLPFIVFVLSRATVYEVVLKDSFHFLILSVSAFFVILSAFGVSLIDIIGANTRSKIGLYSEYSHLALFCMPSLIFVYIRGYKLAALFYFAIFLAISPSTTLLVYAFFAVMFFLLVRYNIFVASLLGLSVAVALFAFLVLFGVQHTLDRLGGLLYADNLHNTNLSSIVWLNGWSQLIEYFSITSGAGVGINRMGCGQFADFGIFTHQMVEFLGAPLNFSDGSFVFSKLVSELGVLGLILVFFIVKRILSFLNRIDVAQLRQDRKVVFGFMASVSLICLFFVRGMGYFNFPFFLAFIWLLNYKRES